MQLFWIPFIIQILQSIHIHPLKKSETAADFVLLPERLDAPLRKESDHTPVQILPHYSHCSLWALCLFLPPLSRALNLRGHLCTNRKNPDVTISQHRPWKQMAAGDSRHRADRRFLRCSLARSLPRLYFRFLLQVAAGFHSWWWETQRRWLAEAVFQQKALSD